MNRSFVWYQIHCAAIIKIVIICAAKMLHINIDIMTSKFPEATILVSELLVRTDIDITMYNIELAKLCKEKGVCVIQIAVTLRDLSDDGLHLLLNGCELFAEDIHKAVCKQTSKSKKGQLPKTMIPPIRGKGKKRKKRDEDNGKPRNLVNNA